MIYQYDEIEEDWNEGEEESIEADRRPNIHIIVKSASKGRYVFMGNIEPFTDWVSRVERNKPKNIYPKVDFPVGVFLSRDALAKKMYLQRMSLQKALSHGFTKQATDSKDNGPLREEDLMGLIKLMPPFSGFSAHSYTEEDKK